MLENNKQKTLQKTPFKKKMDLIKAYFIHSDEKLVAWLLLIGITFSVIALVALTATFAWWAAGFWAALAAKATASFWVSMGQFVFILVGYVGTQVLKNYLVGQLSIRWRHWLTHKTLDKIFHGENNYLDLKRHPSEIDNISQRVQDNVKTFVELTLVLGFDFLKSTLALGVFIGTLWVVGGPLAFVLLGVHVVIPGYLVWVALAIAVVATVITHFIGKSLAETNKKKERAEANLRQDLEALSHDAENIAQEHGENYYKQSIVSKVEEIKNHATQKLNTQSKLIAFQNFYMQISYVLPDLLAAPLYFSGLIELGQLMQIGMSFGEVSAALSWFVNAYEDLSNYKTSIDRVLELEDALTDKGLASNAKSIVIKEKNAETLKIKQLSIMQPQASSTPYIMRHLNLIFKPGEHVLIKGQSGLGKSTLFKAIAGTWKYGEGKIKRPIGKSLYFLPQKPTLPYDTLMGVLAYPEPVETYTMAQYTAVLEAVGGMSHLISKLSEKRHWAKELSGGQQQRISFARVLLKKPDWLFLDESTASLDEESEDRVYTLVKELKNTTLVSIAHRKSVEKHHTRMINFFVTPEKEIQVSEQSALFEAK